MNTKDYLTKIHTNLQDCKATIHTNHSPKTQQSAIVNDTCTLIEYKISQHIIDKASKKILLPPKSKSTRAPLFYGVPKTHKPGCPPRPIVSGYDGPTNHLSAHVTHFIQPLARSLILDVWMGFEYVSDTK